MGGRRSLSDDQLDQMADMREAGATLVAIADHFTAAGTAITPSTIAWQCLRLGIMRAPLHPGQRRPRRHHRPRLHA